jgi:hypothetical protein
LLAKCTERVENGIVEVEMLFAASALLFSQYATTIVRNRKECSECGNGSSYCKPQPVTKGFKVRAPIPVFVVQPSDENREPAQNELFAVPLK